jgi:hypothetical protein
MWCSNSAQCLSGTTPSCCGGNNIVSALALALVFLNAAIFCTASEDAAAGEASQWWGLHLNQAEEQQQAMVDGGVTLYPGLAALVFILAALLLGAVVRT